jgi:hypothetical protein
MNDASEFNSLGRNIRYPSTVNSGSTSTSSLNLTMDHNLTELKKEVTKLRRQNQELEKHKLVRDVQLSTLQYVPFLFNNSC